MSEIKYVCFDIGGVANVRMPREKVFSRARDYFGKDFSALTLAQMVRPTLAGADVWRDFQDGKYSAEQYLALSLSTVGYAVNQENKDFFRTLLEDWCGSPYQPTLNLIDELKENGYHTSVLSNNNEIMYNTPSAEAIKSRVDVAISSHEIGCSKPHWDAFCILLGKMRAEAPGEVLFIDDKLENIEAAKRYGLQGILFRSREIGMGAAFIELTQYLKVMGIKI